MEHWDHNICSGLEQLGVGTIATMLGLGALAGGLCLFGLGLL